MTAAARRFDARLDAAVAELVTDALPPTTAMAARMAPHTTRQRSMRGTLASTLVTGAFVIFAVVGVVATGASISDAMRSGSAVEPQATEPDLDRVDCYIGDAVLEVTVERAGAIGPEGTVAYCFEVQTVDADRHGAMICAQATARGAAARMARESGGAGEPIIVDDGERDFPDACTVVEETDASERSIEADRPPFPSSQFDSWDEAAATTAWPVLRPGWLPDGYQLAALQGFAASNDREAVDSVAATYLRNGIPLSFDQFEIVDPNDAAVELDLPGSELGKVSAGQTTVGDHPAFWAEALVAAPGGGPGSEVRALELVWNDGRIGYRMTARNEDLEALRRIAGSLTDP